MDSISGVGVIKSLIWSINKMDALEGEQNMNELFTREKFY